MPTSRSLEQRFSMEEKSSKERSQGSQIGLLVSSNLACSISTVPFQIMRDPSYPTEWDGSSSSSCKGFQHSTAPKDPAMKCEVYVDMLHGGRARFRRQQPCQIRKLHMRYNLFDEF